jgi:hypothetical protein
MPRVVLLIAVLAATLALRAPDPVGVYCMLDDVILEPNEAAPRQIQLWGAFAIAGGTEAACRTEWGDLQWIGGTGKAIGYGQRQRPVGRLRRSDEPLGAPDPYPIDGGLVKVESKDPAFTDLVARLKAALAGKESR